MLRPVDYIRQYTVYIVEYIRQLAVGQENLGKGKCFGTALTPQQSLTLFIPSSVPSKQLFPDFYPLKNYHTILDVAAHNLQKNATVSEFGSLAVQTRSKSCVARSVTSVSLSLVRK